MWFVNHATETNCKKKIQKIRRKTVGVSKTLNLTTPVDIECSAAGALACFVQTATNLKTTPVDIECNAAGALACFVQTATNLKTTPVDIECNASGALARTAACMPLPCIAIAMPLHNECATPLLWRHI